MSILFLTRTWHGTGGLQRLSRDLWREIESVYGTDAVLVHPQKPGLFSLMDFAFRSLGAALPLSRSVHIHLGDASLCPLGVLLGALTGARVSVTVAGLDVLYGAWWYQMLLRWSIRRVHCVCAISQAAADAVQERGVPCERIVVIPCGIRTRGLPCHTLSVSPLPVLLTVGRLIPRKGVVWFIESVIPLLLQDYPALQYRIIGDGPERMRIARLIRARGLSASVHLLGSLDDASRDRHILDSDLFIMPNIPTAGDIEGFGIVCIEASARGVPVIAAQLEGIADAVKEGETGFFFAPTNALDAAQVIRRALAAPLSPFAVAQATRAQYDWSALIQLYVTFVFH